VADEIDTYRQAVALLLKDAGNEAWTVDELDAAIRLALAELSRRLPQALSADVTLSQEGRAVPLPALTGYLWVEEVWWPYTEGQYPPRPVPFAQRDGQLFLETEAEPQAGDTVHILYAAMQTIGGLDGAASTTLLLAWQGVVIVGAAGYAALAKAAAMTREYSWPNGAATAMRAWGEATLALFQAKLKELRPPAASAWVTWR